jgi:hypothetical protein
VDECKPLLLGSQPARRYNPKKLVENSSLFANKLVETITFLDNLTLKDSIEKAGTRMYLLIARTASFGTKPVSDWSAQLPVYTKPVSDWSNGFLRYQT